jgi:hypothetical protein
MLFPAVDRQTPTLAASWLRGKPDDDTGSGAIWSLSVVTGSWHGVSLAPAIQVRGFRMLVRIRIFIAVLLQGGFALVLATSAAADQKAAADAAQRACRGDYIRLCNGVKPGDGRVIACFREKQDRLSGGCRTALLKLRETQ